MEISEVYKFYEKRVKPVISYLQAMYDTMPMEFLLEIYSAFDHIKRFYIDKENEKEVAYAAINHLKRATLDCFKIHLKLFNDEILTFENNYDLTLLDNGSYYPKFVAKKHEIYNLAYKARLEYKKSNTEDEFELWENIYISISEFRITFIDNYKDDINWVKKEDKKRESKREKKIFMQGLVAGILSSALVSFLILLIS